MKFFDWISCDTFAERVSRALDGRLPWYEKPAYYFRLLICYTSRRFRRQICKLEEFSKKRALYDQDENTELSSSPNVCLGKDCKERMKNRIIREDHH